MRFGAGIAACLLLAAAAGGVSAAPGDCLPSAVLRAINRAERVRIVQLGSASKLRAGPHDDTPGVFMGFTRLESFEIGGRPGGWLIDAFAKRDRYRCDDVGAAGRFAGDDQGFIGVEFDTPSGRVRALVVLPDGRVTVGFASGVRYPTALTEAAHGNWGRFLAEYTRERRSNPGEFMREMLSAQTGAGLDGEERSAAGTEVHGEAGPPSADSEASATCRLPAFGEPSGVTVEPAAITRVAPAYPDIAREAGVYGTVQLHVLVDCVGLVRETRTKKSIPMLDTAAIAAVRQWRFQPAVRGSRPVACWIEVPVKFSLH